MRPDGRRPQIIGPDSGPEPPFPFRMAGKVISGFGRGSKELGIPTANLPVADASWIADLASGVYFGWAGICLPATHPLHPRSSPSSAAAAADPSPPRFQLPEEAAIVPAARRDDGWRLFAMVMSIGYNPFYKNSVRSAEVHILHAFPEDFYGSQMAISLLGHIRPEYDYVSIDNLIEDINEDVEVTKRSLDREKWREALKDPYLWGEEQAR